MSELAREPGGKSRRHFFAKKRPQLAINRLYRFSLGALEIHSAAWLESGSYKVRSCLSP